MIMQAKQEHLPLAFRGFEDFELSASLKSRTNISRLKVISSSVS